MPRRKFVQVHYELIQRDLTNEMLGSSVRLLWHLTQHYFLDLDDGESGVEREELDRIPISSVRMGEITQRKKRDAQKNHLQKLAKRLGFSLEFDGETAWIFWPNWAKRQGLKPRIRDELATNPAPISGEIEKEIEKERERETKRALTHVPESLGKEEKQELRTWAERHVPRLAGRPAEDRNRIWEKFRQHAKAKQWKLHDWPAAFKKWLLSERPPQAGRDAAPPGRQSRSMSDLEEGWARDVQDQAEERARLDEDPSDGSDREVP